MFQLLEPTRATITSVTIRREMHGDDHVPAVSIGLLIETSNTLLDLLDRSLLTALYVKDKPQQGEIEGTSATPYPRLRMANLIESLHFRGELEGFKLSIDWGIDDSSAIVLGACKVDKFRVEPHEGGTIELRLRVGTCAVDEAALGRLALLLDREATIRLTAPERKPEQPQAGGDDSASPKGKAKRNGKADVAQQQLGGEPERGDNWPFPTKDTPAMAADATDAFLQAHGAAS